MESDRIKLVPPSLEYQPQMLEAIRASEHELAEFLPWVPFALTEEESINTTKQAIVDFESFQNELRYSIIEKETDKLVGAIGLIIRDKEVPYFEIGYWLKSSSVGSGYVGEAVQLLENYAFNTLGANRVEIRSAENNLKSRSVAERCGYTLEGMALNDRRLPSGKLSNTVVYSKTGL